MPCTFNPSVRRAVRHSADGARSRVYDHVRAGVVGRVLSTLLGVVLPIACVERAPSPASTRAAASAVAPTRTVIDSLFARFAQPGMPGASVLVVRHDTVLLRESFGLADVEAGVAATPATAYRLASLSKQFTATLIVLLARDSVLSLDTPVRRVLPELPAYASGVTVRHLLTHTSGLWDYEAFVPDTQVRQVHDADALALVAASATRLHFAPGSAWRYSNTGYALLAIIAERVSGARFAELLRRRVFLPLGMQDTHALEEGGPTIPRRAWGYTVRGDSVQRTDQSNTSAVLGDGGVYASIDDLAKWHASLDRAPLVGDSLWRAMTTPHVLLDGTATTYGLGWFVEAVDGRRRLRHHGETRGFTNAVSRYPDAGLTIVVLTNRTGEVPWAIADALAARYLP